QAVLDSFPSYTNEGQPVQLVPEAGPLIQHRLLLEDSTIDVSTLAFEPSTLELDVTGNEPATLRLTHQAPGGWRIELVYTFHPDSYVYDVQARVAGIGTTPQLLVDLGPTLQPNDVNLQEDQRALAFVVNSDDRGIESEPLRDVEGQEVLNGPL